MSENTSDFSDVKVGDKLWSVQLGECHVGKVDARDESLFCVSDFGLDCWYYHDGTSVDLAGENFHQQLFWSRPDIIAPPKPKRKVVNTVEAWVNIYPDMKIKHSSCIHTSEESANEEAGSARIACVHLTGTYEFLE